MCTPVAQHSLLPLLSLDHVVLDVVILDVVTVFVLPLLVQSNSKLKRDKLSLAKMT